MEESLIRLECLKLAAMKEHDPLNALALAKKYEQYVLESPAKVDKTKKDSKKIAGNPTEDDLFS